MRLANVTPAPFETNTLDDAPDFNRRLLRLLRRLLRDTDRRLSPTVRHVGMTLLDKVNVASGYSWPSFRWFERTFGYSSSTLSRAIKTLVKLGYVVVRRRRHRSNCYHPNLALGDVAPHQTATEPVPEPYQPHTSIIEARGAATITAERPNRDKPYFLEPDSCDTVPDEASVSAVEPPKMLGKESKMPSEAEPPELSRPDPAQREMLLPIRGGFALTPAETKHRADRLVQKAITGQDYGTVERLLAYWEPALEPVVEAAVRAGWTDNGILRDLIWPVLCHNTGVVRPKLGFVAARLGAG